MRRSVAELRAIDAKHQFWLDENFAADDPARDAQIECEPRYWMTFDEWCEFVESGENFDTMAKREKNASGAVAPMECLHLCRACQRRADHAYRRLGSFRLCSDCETEAQIYAARRSAGAAVHVVAALDPALGDCLGSGQGGE